MIFWWKAVEDVIGEKYLLMDGNRSIMETELTKTKGNINTVKCWCLSMESFLQGAIAVASVYLTFYAEIYSLTLRIRVGQTLF